MLSSAPSLLAQAGALKPITAGVVYGQMGSFTTNTGNNSGANADTLFDPDGLAMDSSGNLYVADQQNSRVLFYPAGSTTATRAYGQLGSLNGGPTNNGGISANSLSGPYGIALDSTGGLYVADYGNNRVLFYPAGSTTATRVYGQGGSFTTANSNNGGISANSLYLPTAVALDSSGNLYVADQYNSRVLFYPSGSTTATRVYGQGGSFSTGNANNSGINANTLAYPTGLALDSSGNLYVADGNNNRVLFYPSGSTTATQVYGQSGSFTGNSQNNGGISANSLQYPAGLALDSSGNLYVADANNYRVLFYPSGSTTATRVYGQGNSFTANTLNNGGVSANSFSATWALALDSKGDLFVADLGNNRVLEYGTFGNINVCPSGQSTPAPCNSTITLSYYAAADTPINSVNVVTQGATGLDFAQANGGNCSGTILAGNSCTLNVTFAPLAPGVRSGAAQLLDSGGNLLAGAPIYGIGQGPAVVFGPGTQSALIGTGGLNAPKGVALDAAGDLFVANYASNQVVELPAGGGPQTTVGSGLNQPYGLAVDGAGDLFIADSANNRVVEVTPSGVQTTVAVAELSEPFGVAVDGAGDLFIADAGNNRVVEIPAGCTTAACQTSVPTGFSIGIAVDGAGDVFVVDSALVEIPAGCTTAACQITLATGFNNAYGVTVDAAGDLFVADTFNSRVVEIPAGCTTTACQTTVGTGLGYPVGVALDGAGNLFVADSNDGQLDEVNRSQPPTFNFDTTYVGSFSDDSPKSVTLQNVGNQLLSHIAPGLIANSTGFSQTLGTSSLADCTSTFSLVAGAECNLSISFRPTSQASFGSVAVFTDNALNANPAQQVVSLYGTGLNPTVTFTLTGAGTGNGSVSSSPFGINCNVLAGVASGTCSASYPGGTGISLEEIPNPGYMFVGWGGACASSGASQFCNMTLNVTSTASANFIPIGYTLSVTDIGSGTGTVTTVPTGISCSENNGTNSGTCSSDFPNATFVTLTASPSGTSIFTGWGGACAISGTNPICHVSMFAAESVTASFVNQSFGNVNVCPSGQSTPAPCSATLPVTINLAADTTIGVIQVVTQGQTGLDFSLGSGGTCSGAIAAGNSCSVNVTFAPRAPGLRLGAVELFDNSGNSISATPVYGIGQGPAIAFEPAAQAPVNTGSYTLNQVKGITVDAAGDVFIADTLNQRVVKVGVNGTQTTVGSGLEYPQGLAVDGAGDLFIADNLLNEVVEVPAGCATSTCQKTVGMFLRSQLGVAVDGQGDVFIGDFLDGEVVEVPANGSAQTVVYSPGAGSNPVGLAADSAGNLYVADFGLKAVEKVPAGCVTSSCLIPLGSGWQQPDSVAVDAAGDVFVADFGLSEVVEIPAGCTVSTCQIVVASGIQTVAAAVDWAGDVFIPNEGNNQVVEVTRLLSPSLSFALTNVGGTSSDSPQAVSIQNVGNTTLTGSAVLSLGANFSQNGTSTCGSGFSLLPGVTCTESFSFTPQSSGYFTGKASFSDNTFNLSPLVALQTVNLSGSGGLNGQAVTVAVPSVVGLEQAVATAPITSAGLAMGTVSTASSETVPSGDVISQNPAAATQVSIGSTVNLLVSTGLPQPPAPDPLSLENNYFLTGDYVSAGVTLRGTGSGGMATGAITIPTYAQSTTQGVPAGADIVDAFLYWETLESTPTASSTNGTFNGYSISGQQIGNDIPNYTDGAFTGTIRAYRADVNVYLPVGANGIRFANGSYSVSLPDGGTALPLTEGASLVIIYRVLSPNFPLKSIVIYDGAAPPAGPATQVVQGFYDAVGGANGTGKSTNLYASGGAWNNIVDTAATLGQSNQYSAPLNPAGAYAAVILSTPVNNSDNDGILDAWKAGPAAGDFHAGQPGYYDAKTLTWVGLPGAKHGQKDLFVQMDYMCGGVLANGSCDPTQENLYPSPDSNGNDPLAILQQAIANSGVMLHLEVGNAVPETTCTDNLTTSPAQLCQFPNQPGVIGWKNSLEFSKLYPRNLASCLSGGDCTTRFPYGQKDSYHYVLMGHSLAIPAYNTRYASLTSITVLNGITTIGTIDRGSGINACPSRITIDGVLGNPSLNGVYNTTGCSDSKTITVATPGVPNWSYPNSTLPEPVIGITSSTITSISGYSDLGGADSAVTLALWETVPNQDMSKRANIIAGTMFHEIGHTLGLSHGGLYYDTTGSYVPTFEANCKPNYQSIMNYLFQLDGVGPNLAVAFSNQTLETLNENTAGSVTTLTDVSNNPATFSTSAWYVPYTTSSLASPATLHCDGTPITTGSAYRVDAPIAPITPAWSNGQDLNFIGVLQTQERGFNDLTNLDLRQVGATGGEFASLATQLSFGSSAAPLNIAAGGNITLGSGGTVALGSGGSVTLGSGGNVTVGNGFTATLGSGGTITSGTGFTATLGSGGTVTPGSGGNVTLGSGYTATLGSGGTITLGSGGTITLGSGFTGTLGSGGTVLVGPGSGGTITLGSGVVTIPPVGGTYQIDSAGGTITLGSGGNITLGSGYTATLGSGGTITPNSGGNVTLGSGGNVTLGSGGTITLGSGGNVTLGSGGNVTLGSGGTITLGSGGNVTLGSGGNITLGSGGTVTLGSGGNVTLGSGGNVTLGSGGTATLGAGGTITLGSGGNVTLGSGGNVTLGSGGNISVGSQFTATLGSGGVITAGSNFTATLGSGGTVTLGSGATPMPVSAGYTGTFSSGGTITLGSGGNVTLLGSGGNITVGSGFTATLGSGGTITLGSGGTMTLGSGGNVTLGSGGVVTLGNNGSLNLGTGAAIPLATVSNITSGSGGPTSTELTYETANSVVRPPLSPAETSTTSGVRVDWTAPAFGVVQTYLIYRSSNNATPILIGSVSGVNGMPPATEFLDTNPDLTSQTVTYTIVTVLVPDTGGAQRQSQQSAPAVMKNDQTITLGPLPSSVIITSPPTVTATAMSSGVPNGLQVAFSATGSCSIGTQSITSNVSSATLNLNATGSCTVTASQPGTTAFNAANSVSGTFMVLALGSNTQSQTISFAQLPSTQYGNSFSLSASSSSHQTVSFTASGPCTPDGRISGVGICTITALAPATNTYSAASLTQSFNIYPAVLKVTATSFTKTYGLALPSLTYSYSGFVNGDSASVVSGVPALSTAATASSNAGSYPIIVSTGTLATANYSFLYVNGAVTILPASQAITFSTNPPASAVYNSSFTVAATGGASGNAVTFTSAGSCSNVGATYTMTNSTGSCLVIANQAGTTNYSAAPTITKTVTATGPLVTVSPSTISFGTMYLGSVSTHNITVTNSGTAPVTISDPILSIVKGGNSNEFVAVNLCPKPLAAGKSCTITIAFLAGPFYTAQTATLQIMDNAPGSPQPVALSATVIDPVASFSPTGLSFGTVKHATGSTLNVTVSNPGGTPLIFTGAGISVTGTNATAFVQTNACGSSLAAGAKCTVAVKFTPPTTGTFKASLTVVDNAQAGSGTQTVALSGTGN